jgi:hypothetical protein
LGNSWGLEVVRGREVGRVFALGPGRNVLGNALNGEPGIDLGPQEGTSPRRMAPRQAVVELTSGGISLRDLESPGGTFLNRQRVLPDQVRPLQPGDLIQLGAVQLKVVETGTRPKEKAAGARSAPAPAAPPPAPAAAPAKARPGAGFGMSSPFTLASGASCRSWDDFLTVSAQDWRALRDELESGRLDAFFRAIGRDDLRPPATPGRSPDERLDEWLARLPTTRPATADLEVHPSVVRVRAMRGGGLSRTKVVVTNTGYRLLRSTARVEPPATAWLRLAPGFGAGPFLTSESTEIPLEVEVPETLDAPRSGFLTVDSNGGSRRVEVRVEPAVKAGLSDIPEGPAQPAAPGLSASLAGVPAHLRVFGAAAVFGLVRLLVAAGDGLASLIGSGGAARPSLPGAAALLAVAGGLGGLWFARRRGEAGDTLTCAFAGAFAGVLAAEAAVAVCRAVEPLFGSLATRSVWATGPLWAGMGFVVALASLFVVPERRDGVKGDGP